MGSATAGTMALENSRKQAEENSGEQASKQHSSTASGSCLQVPALGFLSSGFCPWVPVFRFLPLPEVSEINPFLPMLFMVMVLSQQPYQSFSRVSNKILDF